MQQLVRLAASNQESLIEGTHELLVTLAALPEVRSRDSAACSALFGSLLRQYPPYTNLGVAALNGDVFCSAILTRDTANVADRSWFRLARDTQRLAVGEYQIGRPTEAITITIGYPVLEAEQVQAVVFTGVDIAWLNRLATQAQLPDNAELIVIDRQGTILAHHPNPHKWIGTSLPDAPIILATLAQGEGTAEVASVDGVQCLCAFTRLASSVGATDVYLIIGIPSALVSADADRELMRNLAGLGLSAVLALAAAWLGGYVFLLRPVHRLVEATRSFMAGDWGVRSRLPHGQGELGQLARTFDEMAETLSRREAERQCAERALRESETRLRLVIEQVPAVLWTTDTELRFTSSAGAGLAALGLRPNQVNGMSLQAYFQTDDPEFIVIAAHHRALRGDSVTFEIEWEDNSYQAHVEPLRDERGHIVGCIGVALDISDCKRVEAELRQHREQLQELVSARTAELTETNLRLQQEVAERRRTEEEVKRMAKDRQALAVRVLHAQEEERMRVSRELHDVLGQMLTVLRMECDHILSDANDPGVLRPLAEKLYHQLGQTLDLVRTLAYGLRTPILDRLGLGAALQDLAADISQRSQIRCEFHCDVESATIPREVATALYRVAQEALTNVVRHSGATQACLRLTSTSRSVMMTVEDNGKGLSKEQESSGKSLGIVGMRERVSIFGGELEIRSHQGQGTSVTARIPLGPAEP
ncbi:HAMP domain-containing protein [Candidatus Acetothermia bacterium]|nr:HAMP domain-containing protein [Candidatus Acetothermia bacterium]